MPRREKQICAGSVNAALCVAQGGWSEFHSVTFWCDRFWIHEGEGKHRRTYIQDEGQIGATDCQTNKINNTIRRQREQNERGVIRSSM